MHLCLKTKAPGVRPESSFVSRLWCPEGARQEMTVNTEQSIKNTSARVS